MERLKIITHTDFNYFHATPRTAVVQTNSVDLASSNDLSASSLIWIFNERRNFLAAKRSGYSAMYIPDYLSALDFYESPSCTSQEKIYALALLQDFEDLANRELTVELLNEAAQNLVAVPLESFDASTVPEGFTVADCIEANRNNLSIMTNIALQQLELESANRGRRTFRTFRDEYLASKKYGSFRDFIVEKYSELRSDYDESYENFNDDA